MSALGSLVVKLALDHAEYTKGLDRNSQAALKFARDTQRTFDGATNNIKGFLTRSAGQVAALVGTVAGVSASLNTALDFDRSLAEVSTLLDGAADSTRELEFEAQRLAKQFGTMPVEQVKAFYQVISAGASDAAEATDILTAANKLAVGGVTQVDVAVDGLTSILNAYGDQVESATAVSDTLFVGMRSGKTTIGELSTNLGKVAPIAASLNVSFDELVATVAALTKGGISTTESITGVRAILAAVAKPAKEATKLSEELGIEFNSAGLQAKGFAGFLDEVVTKTGGSTDKLAQLFGGVEALVPVMALAGAAGIDFNDIMDQMLRKAGATESGFNKMADSRGFKIDQLMASINSIALTLGGTLADVLAPAADWAAQAMDRLFGAQRELTAIEKQRQLISELESELASLNDRRNIPVIGDLIFDKRRADELAQRLDDSRDDLSKLEQQLKETADAAEQLNEPLSEAGNLPNTGDSGSKKKLSEAEAFLQSLKDQAEQAGKTREELLELQAAKFEVSDAAKQYIRTIIDSEAATEREREEAQQLAERLRRAESITLSVATATEIYTDRVRELDSLLASGDLGMDTYNRALAKAKDEFDEMSKKQDKLKDKTQDVFGSMEQFVISGMRRIQGSVADSLFNFFDDGLDGMVRSVKSAVGRIVTEFASIKLLQGSGLGALFGLGSGAALASGVGGGGAGALDLASLASGGLNLVSSGFGINSLLGGGLQSAGNALGFSGLSNFGAGIAGDFLAAGPGFAGGLGSTLGSFAGPAAIAFAGTQILKSLAGDKRLRGGFGNVLNAIGDVPILGDFLPVVPLVNAIFGRGAPKPGRQDLVGTLSASGFEGVFNQGFKEKGGLARSSRFSNFIVDTDSGQLLNEFGRLSESGNIPRGLRDTATDPAIQRALEIGGVLDESMQQITDSVTSAAEKLGIGTESLNGFSFAVDLVTEKGEQLTDADIAGVIGDASNEMVQHLIPSIADLARTGETAVDALVRVGNEFQALENGLILAGDSAADAREQVRSLGLEKVSEIVDGFGGFAEFSKQQNDFFNNVLTESQQLDVVEERVKGVMGEIGINFIPTLDDLFNAFRSGNAELVKLAFAHDDLIVDYHALRESVDSLKESAEETSKAVRQAGQDFTSEDYRDMINVIGKERRAFTAARRELQSGLLDSERVREANIRGLTEQAEKQKDLIRERYDLEARLLDRAKEKGGVISSFIDSLQSGARNILPDTFNDALNLVTGSINSVRGGADITSVITDRLRDSIGSLSGLTSANFATFEEFAVAQGAAASAVNELAALGENQLSVEQLTLGQLEQQTDLLKQLLARDLHRVDSGLEFDIGALGGFAGLSTADDTYKKIVENQFRRVAFILANDINPDPVAVADARDRANTIAMSSTAQIHRSLPVGFSSLSAGVATSSTASIQSLVAEIAQLKQAIDRGAEASEKTARILADVTPNGNAIQTS